MEVNTDKINNDLSSSLVATETETEQSSDQIDSENLNDSYSGEWVYWNNQENEAGGGVSLKITVENNHLNGTFSAWTSNYGRLADSEISGNIHDNVCSTSFSDDGRGHSGTIYLTFGQEQITADISVKTQDSDFTFPSGTTVLRRKNVGNSSKNTLTEEPLSSSLNAIESDNDIELNFTRDSEKASSVKISYGMSYEDINNLFVSVGEKITENPWEEYSNYTIIDEKEHWSVIKTEDDFYKQANLQKTLMNTNMQYTLTFLSKNNSTILTSIMTGTDAAETNKKIKCGDHLNLLLDKYGDNYNIYESEKNNIYEYKTGSGYLRFIIDTQTNLISQWGIDDYAYQDHLDENKKIDSIFPN